MILKPFSGKEPTTLLPAARSSLIAICLTTSGRYRRASGHNRLPPPVRHLCGPDVCSYQLLATSGQQAAAPLQLR